jgi:hypothetical protein
VDCCIDFFFGLNLCPEVKCANSVAKDFSRLYCNQVK